MRGRERERKKEKRDERRERVTYHKASRCALISSSSLSEGLLQPSPGTEEESGLQVPHRCSLAQGRRTHTKALKHRHIDTHTHSHTRTCKIHTITHMNMHANS